MTPRTLRPALPAVLLPAALLLAACGGGRDVVATSARPYAAGPIQKACLAADRSAASPALCGCVQAVADRNLSGRDKGRVPRFFRNPHLAQETRQSDNPRDEAFWRRYKAFVTAAERSCG